MSVGTILVADDDPAFRDLIAVQLELHGYRVLEAEDGVQAVGQARQGRPDVILLDVAMPGRDGFDTLEDLRADPALRTIPVIFVSGVRTSELDSAEGLRRGAHDFLRKPFDPSELVARIQAAQRTVALQEALIQRTGELRRASQVDAVTGQLHRRALEEQLDRMARAADRHGHAFALVLLDVRDLRGINERHGFPAGNYVLRAVVDRVHRRVRGEDIVGRWADGTIAVLGFASAEGASVLAADLGRRVSSEPVDAAGTLVPVTVWTASTIWRPGDGWGDVVRRAEGALRSARSQVEA
jgi:two-component system cell cycle response regulator